MRWRRHPTLCGRHSTTAPFFDYFVNSYISSDGEEGSRDADIITEGKDFVHDSEWVFVSPLTGIEIRHASLFRSTTPHGLCACVQYRENKRITTTGSDCYYAANRRHACQHPPPTKKTTQENCWYTRQEDALKVGNVMVHPCWFYANFKTLKESHSLEAVYGQNITVPTKQGWRVNIKCVSDEENLFLVCSTMATTTHKKMGASELTRTTAWLELQQMKTSESLVDNNTVARLYLNNHNHRRACDTWLASQINAFKIKKQLQKNLPFLCSSIHDRMAA